MTPAVGEEVHPVALALRDPRFRRLARVGARSGVLLCAVALCVSVWDVSLSGVPVASAATDGGPARVITPFDGSSGAGQPLSGGGSATAFSLALPADAGCAGDSANDGYRIQSYMVPAAVDPNTLTFDSTGPVPNMLGASVRQPLYETSGSAYVDAQTANATAPGGPGPVLSIPAFSLGVYVPSDLPAGDYRLGIACTKGPASSAQLDMFWNVMVSIVADAADQPAGVTWTVSQEPTTTTVPGSTTTTVPGSTTTTVPGSTTTVPGSTTTVPGSTTTTVPGSTTTDTTLGIDGGAPTSGGTAGGGASVAGITIGLPVTGASTTACIVWALLLLVFGRVAVLLGRPPRVVST